MSDYDDYDYDQYNYDNQEQIEEENHENIELENNYNQAEDEWRTNPNEAFKLFNDVVTKEANKEIGDRKWSFKSFTFMVLITIQRNIFVDQLLQNIQGFLQLLDRQFKSEGDKALKMIVDALMSSNDEHLISSVLPGLLNKLKDLNQFSIFCSASMKLCKDFYLKQDVNKLKETILNVESIIQKGNITDDDRKKAILAETLAYRVLLCQLTNDQQQIKIISRQLIKANVDLLEPYIVGVINQTIGQLRALERQYEQSRKKFMEAFANFQEANAKEAKYALIYGSVISILENFKMNVFDDMRSKVYDQDPIIEQFKMLRLAYEQQQVSIFSNILNSDCFNKDAFLSQLKPFMQQIIVECKILRYAKCYKTIKLSYLSSQLMIDIPTLQKYVQGLITKKQFKALIDEVGGYIEIKNDESENQIQALKIIVDQIKSVEYI